MPPFETSDQATASDTDLQILSDSIALIYAFASNPTDHDSLEGFTKLLGEWNGSEQSNVGQEVQKHISRAAGIAKQMAAEVQPNADTACLVLNADRRIIAANKAFRTLFPKSIDGGLPSQFLEGDSINLFKTACDRALDLSPLPAFVRLKHEDGWINGLVIAGERAAGTARRLLGTGRVEDTDYVLLTPSQPLLLDTERLTAQSLSLTDAEARLVREITGGAQIKEAARALGISPNTARNQLTSAFEKLGVNKQSDLVRHVAEYMMLASSLKTDTRALTPPVPDRCFHLLEDGRKLAYRTFGDPDGFPVLCFNSSISGSLLDPQEARAFTDAGLRYIRTERPGTGGSTYDPDMSAQSVASDAVELVNSLGHDKVYIVGVASGAPFAVATALALGERVEKLGLFSARLTSDFEASYEDNRSLAFLRNLLRQTWITRGALHLSRLKLSRPLIEKLFDLGVTSSLEDQAYLKANPERRDHYVTQILDTLSLQHEGVIKEAELARQGYQLDLSALTVPVLAWHGEQDRQVAAEDIQNTITRFPNARLHVVPGAGHLSLTCDLENFLTALSE